MITPENWERVRALFQTALERPAAERTAFLREHSDGDDSIRREVESLLAAHADAPSFLDGPERSQSLHPAAPKLVSGSRLGVFDILGPIGSGGMGDVYKARDTRLDRTVAIKVLASPLDASTDSRKRFEREAHILAGLNHPHICTLHDVGHQDGIDYLVMEHLEGVTLAHRLKRGRLPLAQALQYAIEMADALDKAHRAGIVHRDLKAGNVMVTKSGAKLLDFGLARAMRPSRVAPMESEAGSAGMEPPTSPTSLTAHGVILGTLPYMAPEQLQGREADARTDIFALGVVIYEMVTGRRPFQGATELILMAAILEHEPPPMGAAPLLEAIVTRCLAKDPESRWQNARDLKIDLEWVANNPATREGRPTPRLLPWVVAALTGLAALILAVLYLAGASPAMAPAATVRLTLPIAQTAAPWRFHFAVSRDGRRIAYAAEDDLFVRPLDRFEATSLRGGHLRYPSFSPDGRWVAFIQSRKVMKISVTGGIPQMIGEAPQEVWAVGTDWSASDVILIGAVMSSLWQIPASGGAPRRATTLDAAKGELSHRDPQMLPGGKAVIFTVQGPQPNDFHIAVESLATHERRHLTAWGSQGRYVASGHLVYSWKGALLARPFDLERLAVTGPEAVIQEGQGSEGTGTLPFAVADNGTLVYSRGRDLDTRGRELRPRTLVWVNRDGKDTPLPAPSRVYHVPRLSNDGRRLAVLIQDGDAEDVWTYDLVRDVLARLTYDGMSGFPEWHPDNKRLVHHTMMNPPTGLPMMPKVVMRAADGSGEVRILLPDEREQFPGSWSPDGRFLTIMEGYPTTAGDIVLLPMNGERQSRPLVSMPANQFGGRISPNGRWMAYVSNDSGRFEVYVTSFPSGEGKWQISTEGGTEPMWARNGRELFWRRGNAMMAAGIDSSTTTFSPTKSKVLFSGYLTSDPPGLPSYDVAADGRFLMLKGATANSAPTELNVVLNWFEELRNKSKADQ